MIARRFTMSVLGFFHTGVGLAALFLGTMVIFQPKGTPRHRLLGRLFAMAMLLLNVTALMIYNLFGTFGPFHMAALASLATLLLGLWPAWRRVPGWVHRHQFYMSWSYVGLLAATAAEVTSRVPGWDFFWSVTLTVAAVVIAGGSLIGWRPQVVGRSAA